MSSTPESSSETPISTPEPTSETPTPTPQSPTETPTPTPETPVESSSSETPTPSATPTPALPAGCTLIDVIPVATNAVVQGGFEGFVSSTNSPPWSRANSFAVFYSLASFAREGKAFALLQSPSSPTSASEVSVFQTLSKLDTTNSYTFTFYYRPYVLDAYYNAANPAYVAVYLDDVQIARAPITARSVPYLPFTVTGIVPASQNPVFKIKWEDHRPQSAYSNSQILIDSVSLVNERVAAPYKEVSCPAGR
ncbi:hypothetical protein EJ05DRAFT_504098 [Pseudovirgaria hyperparasitica]|uniref:Uncharacterized protein n=1 Tax=Pseudovirgaria hyperparasitica TaxID=470096 RepID=A0A6A6VXZ3_9PEZI|nr:uncharacterized protein EJ05DRAFT_504098 [Pseudovirgaria hyperparasitica]KAF2754564.1 hypothetical protein EJ05DRAFT_504098 [Pseudovirgaria hyperparasitica]